jgi:hypothetical protein
VAATALGLSRWSARRGMWAWPSHSV